MKPKTERSGAGLESQKTDILSLLPEQLEAEIIAMGAPKFHAKQIFRQLHQKRVHDFAKMTELSKQFRGELEQRFYINPPKIEQKLASSADDTVKYLYRLSDGSMIETVRMVYHHGVTACISTQVGCKMGCKFCASAPLGFIRNLRPSEMLGQIYGADVGYPEDQRISGIVLMGIGEPLDNYDNVMQFLRLISAPEGRNLSLRHVTLSTCGIVPQILRLAEEQLPVTLSVSLHSADDSRRDALMPVNRRWPISELLDACGAYFRKTGRRVTFEYAVIAGENDSPAAAALLAKRLRPAFPGQHPHINLIPVNPVAGTGFRAGHAQRFQKLLEREGINATVRRTLGEDIKAACGQLRRDHMEAGEESVVSSIESISGM
ncbi:MAG: 23S rRNA (adenine(2503)-C(2))-methyltransferase RlmN [Oscillospiraceae bacterium]|nr:23S rRNA (adenine(2503)-C(2))-methyltransferase RlmN [Oscillospiraceae bacterium]